MRHFFNACPGSDDKPGASPVVSLAKATTETTPASTCTGGRRSAESNGAAASAGTDGAALSAGTNGVETSPSPQKPQASYGAPGSCPEWFAGLLPGNNQRRSGDRQGLSGREPGTPKRELDSPNPYADHGELRNSAIVRPVTVGYRVDAPAVIAIRDMSHVIASIKSGIVEGKDLRPQFGVIRATTSNPELRQQLKRQLPYFMSSVCERKRANANVKFAWYAILDLDHVGDQEQTKQAILDKFRYARYIFNSVTDGVKVVVEYNRPIKDETMFRRIYDYLAAKFEHLTGLKPDRTNDWARACYFSWDPRLIVNYKVIPVDIDKALAAWKIWNELTARQRQRNGVGTNGAPGSSPERYAGLRPGNQSAGRETGSCSNAGRETGRTIPGGSPELQTGNADPDQARHIIELLCKQRIEYHDWISIGYALYHTFGDQGRELWLLFTENPHYHDRVGYLQFKWNSFRNADGRSNWDTFLSIGRDYGCV